jgi:hypothetical protein
MLWRRCRWLPTSSFLSCGSCPLRRIIGGGQPHNPRKEPPFRVTVPSQRFSRSQGLHPPNTFGPIRADPAHGVSPSGSLLLAEPPAFSGGHALVGLLVAPLRPQPNRLLRCTRLTSTSIRPWSRQRSARRALSRALIPTSTGFFGLLG